MGAKTHQTHLKDGKGVECTVLGHWYLLSYEDKNSKMIPSF